MSKLMTPFLWLDRLLHALRRIVLNLVTLAVLAAIGVGLFQASQSPKVPSDDAVLVVAPRGRLVYSYTQSEWQRSLDARLGRPANEVLIRHLTAAIGRAASDPRVKMMVLNLQDFQGGSLTQLRTVADALARFRKAGKSIYAYASSYSQSDYLLAAQANHVFLNPLGSVLITGYADYQPYFKNLFDRLGVKVYAFRKGKYKSAVEPFTRSDMSEAARVENRAWLQTWWSTYTESVAAGRGVQAAQIQAYAKELPTLVATAGGDTARLALQQGLVTDLGGWHTFIEAVAAAVGKPVADVEKIGYRQYYAATRRPSRHAAAIAVVPIDGMLLDGSAPVRNAVVAGPTVAQLDALVHDSAVRAVVLQVDSPGGSVNAAEEIRRAVVRLRQAGKSVVVSMGTLGASGAYLLSTAAQAIYVHRTTITADIGVFALFPNVSAALDKAGIGVSGVATTPIAGALSPLMPLKPEIASTLQSHVDYLYRRFVDQVAQGRGLSPAEVDRVAQGRAWSGEEAVRLKLANHLGGIDQAIAAAARLAHLRPAGYRVDYLPRAGQQGVFSAASGAAILGLMRPPDTYPLATLRAAAGFLGIHPRELSDAALLLRHARPGSLFAYAFIALPQ